MARRKLNPFTADEAGDAFVPTVKTIKGANVPSGESEKVVKQDKTPPAPKPVEKPDQAKPAAPEQKSGNAQSKVESVPGAVKKSAPNTPSKAATQPVKAVSAEQTKTPAQKAPDRLPMELDRTITETKKGTMHENTIEMVGFNLGDGEFGIDIKQVQDINRMIDITTVPKAPHFVRGVMNLRGKVIPVLSMRSRFGLEETQEDKGSRIIVVEIKGTIVGFIVDSVSEVLRIPSKTIENTTDLVNWVDADYIKGVAKYQGRLLVLIDLEKVLFGKRAN